MLQMPLESIYIYDFCKQSEYAFIMDSLMMPGPTTPCQDNKKFIVRFLTQSVITLSFPLFSYDPMCNLQVLVA